jgi:hypothetical protein
MERFDEVEVLSSQHLSEHSVHAPRPHNVAQHKI